MAFVDPTQPGQDENNQNPSQVDQALNPSASQQAQQQSQSQQAPPSTSAGGAGVASTGGGGAGAAAAAASAPKPSSSGSWTNLDSYLNANSDQATQIGQQIAGSINNVGNQAQNDISNLGSNFNSAVNQNTVNQNPDAINQAVSDASSLTAGQNLSAADQQAFNGQANASYSGPTDVTSFNGYNQAQQEVNAANQKAQETQSEAGRGTLLNDQFQNSSQYGYTAGENNLDQLLLENSPGAQSALQPLPQQWGGLTGALNNDVTTGSAAAQKAIATNQATAAAAQDVLGTATTNFQNQMNTGLANLQKTDIDSYNQILTDMQNNNLSPADYAALGLDPNQHIYGPSGTFLPTYLNQGPAPTLQSYATADQYAQAQALAQLAGQSSSSFLNPGSVSQAGTAQNAPAYTFDSNRFASDNASNEAEYNQNNTNLLNTLNRGFVNPWGDPMSFNYTSIPNAVSDLNNYITQYGSQSPTSSGYGYLANWAKQQLQTINQAQIAAGFQPFPIVGQATPVTKQ